MLKVKYCQLMNPRVKIVAKEDCIVHWEPGVVVHVCNSSVWEAQERMILYSGPVCTVMASLKGPEANIATKKSLCIVYKIEERLKL